MFQNAVELSHFYLQNTVKPGAFCVDATCGNGKDTVFLASLVKENGHVFAFDIQKAAIENTRAVLEKSGLSERVKLILDGHENMASYLGEKRADAFVFNLGYLPKGDHIIKTQGSTTVAALDTALSLLKPNGIIIISIYHGGDSGFSERDTVLQYLQSLDPHEYHAVIHSYTNQPNFPPILALICRHL